MFQYKYVPYIVWNILTLKLFSLATPALAPNKTYLLISTHLYSPRLLHLGWDNGLLKLKECDRSDALPVSDLSLEET